MTRTLEPLAFITQTLDLPPARDTKAMYRPSGDQAGFSLRPPLVRTWTGEPPSVSMTMTWKLPPARPSKAMRFARGCQAGEVL